MTESEREKFIDQICETIKNWSIDDLRDYVISVMENSLEDLTDDELKEKHSEICGK